MLEVLGVVAVDMFGVMMLTDVLAEVLGVEISTDVLLEVLGVVAVVEVLGVVAVVEVLGTVVVSTFDTVSVTFVVGLSNAYVLLIKISEINTIITI